MSNTPAHHDSFRWLASQEVASLKITVHSFVHQQTGALHYHLETNQPELVFMAAFRTFPQDSTGVAHILEHTALCGSERYPVRDPFFMMLRRSLNTFMNALTSSDWTAYPFATLNPKDFDNLLDVYLDAAFFSRLDPLDFAQEGHRVEFTEPENPSTPLVYKGVVFNEMKGAMSSPVSRLYQSLTKYLFPSITYHHNSGGEPESIPDLSYADLRAFYQRHYHPSNAILMSFGALELETLQHKMHQQALSRFEALPERLSVPDEKRYAAPVRVEEAYALEQDDLARQTYHVLGWLLPPSYQVDDLLKAHLLSRVLLDNSSSPLMAALESTDLGTGPAPLCGVEDSNREMSFLCALEGSDPEQAADFEALVIETLQKVVAEGIDQQAVEAQLHQLELSQREITGDGMPFGLQLLIGSLSAAVHHGDPVELLNIDPALLRLREAVQDPRFIPDLIQTWLLDNPHRVRLTLRPDDQLAARQQAMEQARLAKRQASLTPEEQQQIIAQTLALQERQAQQDDLSLLPKVTVDDIPAHLALPEPSAQHQAPLPVDWYTAGTNGLIYQQIFIELPQLSAAEQQLLPLYTQCVTELGCGERDYRQQQAHQSAVSGGVSASVLVRSLLSSEQQVRGYLVLSGKALASKHLALQELLYTTLTQLRFDETSRIRELIAQQASRRVQSITGRGHSLAMTAAGSALSPVGAFAHATRGLAGVQASLALEKRTQDQAELEKLAADLAALHRKLALAPRQFMLVGEAEQQQSALAALNQQWQACPAEAIQALSLPQQREAVKQVWVTNTQVNFCALAFPTVVGEHADAPALTLLGEYLRNGYLHRAIREQGGAYGAGAAQDHAEAVFRFFSYRDPRTEATLADFHAAVAWLLAQQEDPQKLEEAVLGVISSIDKPGSPAGDARQTYQASLFGRTPEQRRAFRQRLLEVRFADLQRVAATYLRPELASCALVTNASTAATLDASYQRYQI